MKDIYSFYLDTVKSFFNWNECDHHIDIMNALIGNADTETALQYFRGYDNLKSKVYDATKKHIKNIILFYLDDNEKNSFDDIIKCYYDTVNRTMFSLLVNVKIDYTCLSSKNLKELLAEFYFNMDSIGYTILE